MIPSSAPPNARRALQLLCAIAALAAAPPLFAGPGPVTDARAFLVGVYKHYPITEGPHAFESTGVDAPKVFTPALIRLLRQDQKLANGEVGALDGDPLCDCNDDGGLKTSIGAVSPTGPTTARAAVTLTFPSSPKPEIRHLVIRLSLEKVGWRIADIATQTDPSLSAYLAKSNRENAKAH